MNVASEDEWQQGDNHHDEKDWEAHKEDFRICYIDNNMTRKDAAQYMKDYFNFDATPRQWERKIKQWGFSKYSSRDERLHQIAQTGKSVYEVSRPGRRPRSQVDERGNLHPHEDRNLRRFARREVSRSRSRSRSNSFTNKLPPKLKQEFSDPTANASTENTFDLNLSGAELRHHPSNGGFSATAPPAVEEQEPEQPLPLHYIHEQKSATFGEPTDPDLVLSVSDEEWAHGQVPGMSRPFNAPGDENQYPAFPDILRSPQGTGNQNPSLQYPISPLNPSLNYPIANHSVPVPAGFNQYAVAGDNVAINPNVLSDNMMADPPIFNNALRMQPGPNPLDQSDFENTPIFRFDLVDADATTVLAPAGETAFPAMEGMQGTVPGSAMSYDGPLQNDVMPLVEEYTRAVHAAALWSLSKHQYGDGLGDELAANLDQPSKNRATPVPCLILTPDLLGQAFITKMAVVLDNFAKSQQRSLQSMRDTCSKLRQKNAWLEEISMDNGKSPNGSRGVQS